MSPRLPATDPVSDGSRGILTKATMYNLATKRGRPTINIFDEIGDHRADRNIMKTYARKHHATSELFIYEDIDEFSGVGAKQFAQDLRALGNVSEIDLRINSYGGSVFEGFAIYTLLVAHPATKHVFVDGIAASIASVIAMAGDTIEMGSNAELMIHNAWSVCVGDALEMRACAEILEQLSTNIRDTYVARTGIEWKEMRGMMDAETWMNASQAKDMGFVDMITEPKKAAALSWKPAWSKHRTRKPSSTAPTSSSTASVEVLRLRHAQRTNKRQQDNEQRNTQREWKIAARTRWRDNEEDCVWIEQGYTPRVHTYQE